MIQEVSDPAAAIQAAHGWSDLGKIEVYPVIETEKLIALFEKK